MEKICQTQVQQWDKPIEKKLQKVFTTWILELSQNDLVAVERWFKRINNDTWELDVLGDASKDVFCALAYNMSAGIVYRHVSFAMHEDGIAPIGAS